MTMWQTTGMAHEAHERARIRPVALGRTALGLVAAATLAPIVAGLFILGTAAVAASLAGPSDMTVHDPDGMAAADQVAGLLFVWITLSLYFGAPVSFAATACIGIPGIWLARRLDITAPLAFAAGGLGAAAFGTAGLAVLIGMRPDPTGVLGLGLPLLVAGMASGLIYWWIAERPWLRDKP